MSRMEQEYTRQVRSGLGINDGNDPLAHCALGLAGEAGEVAELVKKSQYKGAKPLSKSAVLLELGDVLWYLTSIADMNGFTIEEVMEANIAKLQVRHSARGIYDLDRLRGVPLTPDEFTRRRDEAIAAMDGAGS